MYTLIKMQQLLNKRIYFDNVFFFFFFFFHKTILNHNENIENIYKNLVQVL